MIDYIIKKQYLVCFVKNNNYYCLDIPITRFFNRLLKPYLTDLKSREKQTKMHFNFSNKIPIFIDKNHLFLAINTYRLNKPIYINYFSIYRWVKTSNNVIVEFLSGHCLKLHSYKTFVKQLNKVKIILADDEIKIN